MEGRRAGKAAQKTAQKKESTPRSRQHHQPTTADFISLRRVWGHVLDYMPYPEVRSALLIHICKMMANEAVKCTHALNVMQVHQVDGPAARRFPPPNVEEVNCFSLISTHSSDDKERPICAKTAARLVPFLATIHSKFKACVCGWLAQ